MNNEQNLRNTFIETWEGEYDSLPECPTCKLKCFPDDDGGEYSDSWYECPKCGFIPED